MPPTPAAPDGGPEFPPEPWRNATVPAEAPDGDLSFTCPRCATAVTAAAYGPCSDCRRQLRATVAGEARAVQEADYVPKVNVTPNAVALKD